MEGNQWEYANLTILRRLRAVIPLTCLLETLLQPGERVGFAIVGMIALLDLLRQESPKARAFSLSRAAWRGGVRCTHLRPVYRPGSCASAGARASTRNGMGSYSHAGAGEKTVAGAARHGGRPPNGDCPPRSALSTPGLAGLPVCGHCRRPADLMAAAPAWAVPIGGPHHGQAAPRDSVAFRLASPRREQCGRDGASVRCYRAAGRNDVWLLCARGLRVLAKEVAVAIKEHLQAQNLLTPREKEILRCMARSCSYRTIAQTLQVSEGTIRAHAANIMQKAGVHSRLEAVRWAEGLRVLPVDPVGSGSSQDARGRSAPD